MDAVKIEGTLRNDLTKQATLKIRKEGNVPCVIYGGKEVIHFSVSAKALKPLVYTPDFKKAELTLNGRTMECIIQDMHFDTVSDVLIHLDFIELTDKKVTVELPLKFVGVSKGVREGGKLIPRLRTLRVKSLPSALRAALEVNVEKLELGKHIRVKELSYEGIEIITAANNPVVSALVPRQLKVEEAAAKPAAAAATPAAGAAAPAAAAAAKPAAKK